VAEPNRASPVSAAGAPTQRTSTTRSVVASWTLRVATAAALGVDAAVHWRNAPAYDAVTGTISQGQLFRAEAAAAVVVGLLVLLRPRTGSWVAALLVAGSALGAVLLYRYVHVGALGPLPDMYENTWQVPGKLLSAYAEGAAVVLAALGLRTHRSAATPTPLPVPRLHEMAMRSDETPIGERPTNVDSAEEGDRMPAHSLAKVLYTAEAVIEGGRAGHGRTADGRLDLQLSVPQDMGGPGGPGTNPSSCSRSATGPASSRRCWRWPRAASSMPTTPRGGVALGQPTAD
jgi:hypothetical protein